jgi:hypothetical protein
MEIPQNTPDLIRKAADWLDVGDSAMKLLLEIYPNESVIVSGDSVQETLRSLASFLEENYPEACSDSWNHILDTIPEIFLHTEENDIGTIP